MPTTRPRWLRPTTSTTSSTQPGGATPTGGITEQRLAELPSGIVPYTFGLDNVAASLAASRLYRAFPGAAATFAQVGILPPFRGSIVGMQLHANTPKTGGTATLEAYVAGVASGALLAWDNIQRQVSTFAEGLFIFEAEAEVDVRITTSAGFLPITVDLELILLIAQTTSESVAI